MGYERLAGRRPSGQRGRLRAVAYRMLGSRAEAEDAVQEAWLRLEPRRTGAIDNLGGWLTTVVARVCLDMLRSRKPGARSRYDAPCPNGAAPTRRHPEDEALLADRSGWHCSWCSTPSRPPSAWRSCCTTCSRCRSRRSPDRRPVHRGGASAREPRPPTRAGHARRGAALVTRGGRCVPAASREATSTRLLAVLDPDVVARGELPRCAGAAAELARCDPQWPRPSPVGRRPLNRALVDGMPGAAWRARPGDASRGVHAFTVVDGRIVEIEMLADPGVLSPARVELVRRSPSP